MNSEIIKLEIKEIIGLADDSLKNPQKYNCMCGVSLGAKHYSYKRNVKAYVSFLTQFNRILIFINDYNYHWDLMAFQNMNKSQAIEKAKRMGNELKNSYKNIIQQFSLPKNKVRIITFFELWEDVKFKTFQAKFHKILLEDKKIKKEIEKDLDNQIFYTISIKEKLEIIKKNMPEFYQSAIHFCKNYILDQLIAGLYLMFKQPAIYNIRISPTPYKFFLILRKTLEDKYRDLKEKLKIKESWGYLSICLPNQTYG